GAPLQTVPGRYDPHQLPRYTPKATTRPRPAATPYAAPWTDIANYPSAIMDSGVAVNNGKLYAVGGTDGAAILATGAVYIPVTGVWTAIAPMANARENPQAAFINGKLYVSGGWGSDGNPVAATEIYDPATNTGSTGAAAPAPLSAGALTVVRGQMY